ncbi:DNA polymerase III subunit beta [Clostridium sp. UBA3887]|uniref:DNA polymerase III subunit beta n=1 Tax=Clostridium sp. UBA3887 TaxID=1946356 RepID=UPI003216EA4C
MKIKINVDDIHQVLKVSNGENISIIASENTVHIISDIKSGIDDLSSDHVMCKSDYPWVEQKGKTLISRQVLQSLPTNGELTITEDTLECGNRKISYKPNRCYVEPISNFKDIATINREIFNDLIEVEYALAKDETRPTLTAVCISGNEFVALDGFRIAIRKSNEINIEETLLPGKLIKTYKKIKGKVNEVTILEAEKNVALKIGNVVIVVTKLLGDYIKYKSVIPTEFSRKAEINSKELLSLLKSYKKVEYVILNFTEKELKITAKNETLTIEDKLDCKFKGENLEIAFNHKYLMETIKHYENLTMKFNSNTDPVVITNEYKTDLVLPVRINKN